MKSDKFLLLLRIVASGVALILLLGFLPMERVGAAPVENARIVINIPARTLWLYSGDRLIRYYPVGLGRVNFPTPLGKHQVIRKVIHPAWENPYLPSGHVRIRPGRGNPLGTRWIGFKDYKGGEYGIHGTNQPRSVGKFSSHGCIRMKIKDAEDLFERVDVGTPLEVVYEPVQFRESANTIQLVNFPDRFRKGVPTAKAVMERILAQYPTARIDQKQLLQVLKRPTEKYITVGQIPSPPLPPIEPDSTKSEQARQPDKPREASSAPPLSE